ncbi:hypothetical protein, partial [Aestuariivirga sp.]|uniref:hypothetical protein n=1 Tax=Aestuariivirga sp. TaxID=2650926 RepID=UPI00378468B6
QARLHGEGSLRQEHGIAVAVGLLRFIVRHWGGSDPDQRFMRLLEHDRQKWKPLLRQDHAQAIDLARVLFGQVVPPGRNARWSMIAKSGNHFCGKIMLKQLILREFFPARWFHLAGTRAGRFWAWIKRRWNAPGPALQRTETRAGRKTANLTRLSSVDYSQHQLDATIGCV